MDVGSSEAPGRLAFVGVFGGRLAGERAERHEESSERVAPAGRVRLVPV